MLSRMQELSKQGSWNIYQNVKNAQSFRPVDVVSCFSWSLSPIVFLKNTILNSILCTLRINNLGSYLFLNQTTSQDHLDSLMQSSEDGEEEDHRK